MQVINWLEYQPTDKELKSISSKFNGVVHQRQVMQELVRFSLQSYPWGKRQDLVDIFGPQKKFHQGELVAFPIIDSQGIRPDSWRIYPISHIREAGNPIQGTFQVVYISSGSSRDIYAANLQSVQPLKLNFPPEDEEDFNLLVGDFLNEYEDSLRESLRKTIEESRLKATLTGDDIFIGDINEIITEDDQTRITSLFDELDIQKLWLSTDELLAKLRETNRWQEIPDEIATFSLCVYLESSGYVEMGEQRWATHELIKKIDRSIDRRQKVPVKRSRIAAQFGEEDDIDFGSYEEMDFDEEEQETLLEIGEEEVVIPEPSTPWQPSTSPVKLPSLTYLHIMQGFFPLTKNFSKAFDPSELISIVNIQVIEGEHIPFLVIWEDGVIKSIEKDAIYFAFQNADIYAGTHLWLEYQGPHQYRIFPRPLPQPKEVRCKYAYIEDGTLNFDVFNTEMQFEGDPQLFKAEMRFENLEALFAEADKSDLSIFDAMWHTFPQLAQLHPEGLVHRKELFNAVFFQIRMCSPWSVVAELYSHLCFVPVGEGYFRFDPSQGVKRRYKTKKKKPVSSPSPITHTINGEEKTRPFRRFNGKRSRPMKDSRQAIISYLEGLSPLAEIEELQTYSIFKQADHYIWIGFSAYHENQNLYWFGLPQKHIQVLQSYQKSTFVLLICGHPDQTLVIPFEFFLDIGISKAPINTNGRWLLYVNLYDDLLKLSIWEGQTGERQRYDVTKYLNNYTLMGISDLPIVDTSIQDDTYFIFQQKKDSSYADQEGAIYNWRKGIPGANQIQEGSRFIYYRTGEKVFFGTGTIGRIDQYTGGDDQVFFNGHITDYHEWHDHLPLKQIADYLDFITTNRIWVGQSGIRQISKKDFDFIISTYKEHSMAPNLFSPLAFLGDGQVLDQLRPEIFKNVKASGNFGTMVWKYKLLPDRYNVLFCREAAHQRIKKLLAVNNLDQLTLEDFHQHIWQLGSVEYYGEVIPHISNNWFEWIENIRLPDLVDAYEKGKLLLHGNQTWGSGSNVIAPMLNMSNIQKERMVQEVIGYLLYSHESFDERITKVINDSNGFGINSVSGLLAVIFPKEHILYNKRSVEALVTLGIPWEQEHGHGELYSVYRRFCKKIRDTYGFISLVDVDWFIYNIAIDRLTPTVKVIESSPYSDTSEDKTISTRFVNQKKNKSTTVSIPKDFQFSNHIKSLEGQTLRTLAAGRKFTIIEVDKSIVVYQPISSNETYSMSIRNIKYSWNALTENGELRQAHISHGFLSYIPAILATFPGVTYKTDPVRLYYSNLNIVSHGENKQTTNGESTQPALLERTRSGQLVSSELIPEGPLFEKQSGKPSPKNSDEGDPQRREHSSLHPFPKSDKE